MTEGTDLPVEHLFNIFMHTRSTLCSLRLVRSFLLLLRFHVHSSSYVAHVR